MFRLSAWFPNYVINVEKLKDFSDVNVPVKVNIDQSKSKMWREHKSQKSEAFYCFIFVAVF